MSEWIKRLAEKYSEVNEKKLTGNQHKLDMDKDGDIDATDFKHMRNKKKANEEEEVVMNPKKDKKDSKETMAAEATMDTAAGRKQAAADADAHHKAMVKKHGADHPATKDAAAAAKAMKVKANESTLPPVYARIMEERAKHYKGATKPEDWNEKEKNNKGAMDMKKDMAVDTSDKISNYDDLGHDDASKAGRITKSAKGRPGDNAAGDTKVVNPVKGTK